MNNYVNAFSKANTQPRKNPMSWLEDDEENSLSTQSNDRSFEYLKEKKATPVPVKMSFDMMFKEKELSAFTKSIKLEAPAFVPAFVL